MTRKRRRLLLLSIALLLLAGATALVLNAFDDSLVFFYSPTELAEKSVAPGQRLRIGGLVEEGSVVKEADGVTVRFRVTDLNRALDVVYRGVLPDLFREGQGVVAEGTLAEDGSFLAASVLAKHDETYMPPEVAEALKKQGVWRDGAPDDAAAQGTTP
jgi:cytochrome c-type biogenesis protein CcmE